MLFTLIFGGMFVIGWSICGLIPWLIASTATRGNAGLSLLPLGIFAANVAAVTVPLVGFDGSGGLQASFVVAFLASAAIMLVRRFALGSLGVANHSAPTEPPTT